MPKHEPAPYLPTAERTKKRGRVINRCPVCGLKLRGVPAKGVVCTGREDRRAAPAKPVDVACIYRNTDIVLELVECVPCAKRGNKVQAKVFPCTFEPGRKCSMVNVGCVDVTFCGLCGDRNPKEPSVAAE